MHTLMAQLFLSGYNGAPPSFPATGEQTELMSPCNSSPPSWQLPVLHSRLQFSGPAVGDVRRIWPPLRNRVTKVPVLKTQGRGEGQAGASVTANNGGRGAVPFPSALRGTSPPEDKGQTGKNRGSLLDCRMLVQIASPLPHSLYCSQMC